MVNIPLQNLHPIAVFLKRACANGLIFSSLFIKKRTERVRFSPESTLLSGKSPREMRAIGQKSSSMRRSAVKGGGEARR